MIARCHGRARGARRRATASPRCTRAANFSYRTAGRRRSIRLRGRRRGLRGPDLLDRRLHRHRSRPSSPRGRSCKAFRDGRFEARRFAGYERRVHQGCGRSTGSSQVLRASVHGGVPQARREIRGMVTAVIGVLAGGSLPGRGGSGRLRSAVLRHRAGEPHPGWVRRQGLRVEWSPGWSGSGRFSARCGGSFRGYCSPSLGIAVGVAGLVALGAMAERIVALHRGRRPLRARPDLGGGRGHGHGRGLHRRRPAAAPPRSEHRPGARRGRPCSRR